MRALPLRVYQLGLDGCVLRFIFRFVLDVLKALEHEESGALACSAYSTYHLGHSPGVRQLGCDEQV